MTLDENSEKILSKIIKMKENGELPNREKLLENFQKSGFLLLTNKWFYQCNDFLAHSRQAAEKFNNLKNHPYESVLYAHLIRMQRYMLALSQLSWIDKDKGMVHHSIDGFYPILKSVFELSIEFCLAVAYSKEFGENPNWELTLTERINQYASLTRKKNNYKFWWINSRAADEPFVKLAPPDIIQYLKQGKENAKEELIRISSQYFDGARFKDVRHWFPIKDNNGNQIGGRNAGSMDWRCVDVLSKYSPDSEFWIQSYHSTYELLNRYSHPVMGYDDNYRSTRERLFDLCRMQVIIITLLYKFVIPEIVRSLQIKPELNKAMLLLHGEMAECEKELFTKFPFLDLALNSQQYTRS